MGERITHSELVERWRRKKPRFFRRLQRLALSVITVAVTIHLTVEGSGGQHADWWQTLYPYLVGICAGIYAACMVTVDGGYSKGGIDLSHGHTPLVSDIDTDLDGTPPAGGGFEPRGPREPHDIDPIDASDM